MIATMTCFLVLWVIAFGLSAQVCAVADEPPMLSSLAELADAAPKSGQKLKMKPGKYRLTDFIPPASIPERRKQKQWQFITFSGHDNSFDLRGVTIELDTAPNTERQARGLILRNQKTMPVVIGSKAEQSRIHTLGPVLENKGKDILVTQLAR